MILVAGRIAGRYQYAKFVVLRKGKPTQAPALPGKVRNCESRFVRCFSTRSDESRFGGLALRAYGGTGQRGWPPIASCRATCTGPLPPLTSCQESKLMADLPRSVPGWTRKERKIGRRHAGLVGWRFLGNLCFGRRLAQPPMHGEQPCEDGEEGARTVVIVSSRDCRWAK